MVGRLLPIMLLVVCLFLPQPSWGEESTGYQVIAREIRGENAGGEWNLTWPEFQGGTADWKALNENLAAEARQREKEFPPEALEAAREIPPDLKIRCSLNQNYVLETNETGLISLVFTISRFMGGAHGVAHTESRIVDPATGNTLKFEDLFPAGTMEKLCTEVNRRIKASASLPPDHPEQGIYFPEAVATPELPVWFLRGADIVLQFPVYSIAPYAAGMPEFAFPLKEYGFRAGKSAD